MEKDYWCIQGVGRERIEIVCNSHPLWLWTRRFKISFFLHDEMKMMLLVLIATNDMIRYVLMYPEVWFLDCTADE
jgi:hypothetical protein